MTIFDDPQIIKDAQQHALEEYPKESVGAVIANKYVRLINEAADSTAHFETKFETTYQALIHSHPDESPAPSAHDMRQQQATALPWAILSVTQETAGKLEWFGDQTPIQPYLGRTFLSGMRDCWCLVRDWYRKEKGIILDNLPRSPTWAKEQVELISAKTIQDTGLYQISVNELQVGDVVAARIGARIVNHTAIYVGRGLVLHHPSNGLSCHTPIAPWQRFVRYYLRHKST